MSEKLKALSKQWFEKVWNQQDESAIDQLAAPDVIAHGLTSGGEHFDGTSPFLKFYRPFVSAFPNLHIAVEDVIAEGDKTVVRIRFTGKHTGDGLGIAPTGNNVSVTGLVMMRWRGEKIVEAWNEFDAAGMLQQLQGPAKVKI
jgi:predicted ester cyclase